MQTIDKVLDRIRKLLALARSPGATEAEAANAAAKAAATMTEYDLENAQVEVDTGEVVDEPLESETIETNPAPTRWKFYLMTGICMMTRAKHYYARRGRKEDVKLYGRTSQVRTTKYLYAYLCGEVDRLAREKYTYECALLNAGLDEPERKRGFVATTQGPVTWKHGFRVGCSDRLFGRMKEIKDKQDQEGIDPRALVVMRRRDEKLNEGFKTLGTTHGKMQRRGVSAAGYASGKKTAEGISLSNSSRPQLGAAPARIAGQ